MEKELDQKGTVSALFISRDKGQPREKIVSGFFRKDYGLEGDAWSGPGDRQVVILSKRIRDAVINDTRNGLCYKRFRETLQIKDFPWNRLVPGCRFRAGEVCLEVSGKGKRCFSECEILKTGTVCELKHNAVFARVLEAGVLSVGDAVEIED